MKIKNIKIENYTVFQNNRMEFGDGINIFIGENGTGKTHLMKLMYSAAQSADPRVSVAYKLVRTMLPDDYKIARLLMRRPGSTHASVRIVAQNEKDNTNKNLTISFHSKTKKWDADVTGETSWEESFQGEESIFIIS